MTRRILTSYLVMTLVIVVMLVIPLGLNFAGRERDRLLTAIERDSRVLAAEADDAFENGQFDSIPALADRYVRQTGGRVVFVKASGESVLDSDDPTGPPRDFSTRPEISQALKGRYTSGQRPSTTLGESLLFVAVPITHDGSVIGVVRVSYPTAAVDQRTREVWIQLASLGAVVLGVVGVAGWFVASTLGRPIRQLEHATQRLAAGDLAARAPLDHGPDDLIRVAKSFNTMAARVQGLVESQRSFLADASHQLRTPLTALRLRLEALADADEPDVADIAALGAEVDRLSELVDGLLAVARLDAQPGELTQIDVGAVITERVAAWSPLADEREVRLSCSDGDRRLMATVVQGGLEQILDNLIANAIDVAPVGSEISVDLATSSSGMVRVTVSDEGPGLTEAQIARAFDRFWRGPNPSDGGSGLGLAIVRRLAEASDGSAEIRPAPGGGLSVEVDLPAATTTADHPR